MSKFITYNLVGEKQIGIICGIIFDLIICILEEISRCIYNVKQCEFDIFMHISLFFERV